MANTLEIYLNKDLLRWELHFSKTPEEDLSDYLERLGYRYSSRKPRLYYAPKHEAYKLFAEDLKDALLKNKSHTEILVKPSYAAHLSNIIHNKFSYVTISYETAKSIRKKNFVLFDQYKKIAEAIAQQYGERVYGKKLKFIEVTPRVEKKKAKKLLEKKAIIDPLYSMEDQLPDRNDIKEANKEQAKKHLTNNTEEPKEFHNLKNSVSTSTEALQGLADATDLDKKISHTNTTEQLTDHKKTEPAKKYTTEASSVSAILHTEQNYTVKTIQPFGFDIPNIRIPNTIPYPFDQGGIQLIEIKEIHKRHPQLICINNKTITSATALQLFQLAQIPALDIAGFKIHKKQFHKEWTKRGKSIFKELDFPMDLNYPYVSIITGYITVESLSTILEKDPNYPGWLLVADQYRPIAYPHTGIVVIEIQIEEFTKELKTLQEKKESASGRQNKIEEGIKETRRILGELKASKKVIEIFINSTEKDTEQIPEEKEIEDTSKYSPIAEEEIIEHKDTSFITVKDIVRYDQKIPNVWIPKGILPPFDSGGLYIKDAEKIQKLAPHLLEVSEDHLSELDGKTMFELSQMAHPDDFGFSVTRSRVLREWEKRGESLFKELGYPMDLKYPYVNIHVGYRSVEPLGKVIGSERKERHWWSVIEHTRPIADLRKAILFIEQQIELLRKERNTYIHPKTRKPKTKKEDKEQYSSLSFTITSFENSKIVIQEYLDIQKQDNANKTEIISKPTIEKDSNTIREYKEELPKALPTDPDYLDKVIAIMHDHYMEARRLSRKEIEAIQEKANVPNMGMLWEAVELSWLLWYKFYYKEPVSFANRLKAMIRFWDMVQPTYTYSDSSKELYKQYSTPCPIGAMIAEYTQMAKAKSVFEPSAGNGLLVLGANPKVTHVNEIDKNRRYSLEAQGFKTITHLNAAEPFPKEWTASFDVVVTNPPFASWDADAFDKKRIVHAYFNRYRRLDKNRLRLEHVMSGLALHTLKDSGKAALIIMGHIYFDDRGYIAKSRPFFNWLYMHYRVDDILNMNGFTLYNKQGATPKTMLILINGRRANPSNTLIAPTRKEAASLDVVIDTFEDLWKRIQSHIKTPIELVIQKLKIENGYDIL